MQMAKLAVSLEHFQDYQAAIKKYDKAGGMLSSFKVTVTATVPATAPATVHGGMPSWYCPYP